MESTIFNRTVAWDLELQWDLNGFFCLIYEDCAWCEKKEKLGSTEHRSDKGFYPVSNCRGQRSYSEDYRDITFSQWFF